MRLTISIAVGCHGVTSSTKHLGPSDPEPLSTEEVGRSFRQAGRLGTEAWLRIIDIVRSLIANPSRFFGRVVTDISIGRAPAVLPRTLDSNIYPLLCLGAPTWRLWTPLSQYYGWLHL